MYHGYSLGEINEENKYLRKRVELLPVRKEVRNESNQPEERCCYLSGLEVALTSSRSQDAPGLGGTEPDDARSIGS